MKKKSNWKWRGILLLLAVTMLFGVKGNVLASDKTVTCPGTACKVGRYIYYAYELSGIRMGLMRYDTKTGKKKEITGYKYKGNTTNGFKDISVKGKYIYVTWDLHYGTDYSEDYIYRINKITGAKKRIAEGTCPVIIGKYIYYIAYKCSVLNRTYYIYQMNLNGSGKKKIYTSSDEIYRLYSDGEQIYYVNGGYTDDSDYLYMLDGEAVLKSKMNVIDDGVKIGSDASMVINNYKYYLVRASGGEDKLYRENIKTGKRQLVIKYDSITDWRVCESHVMAVCETKVSISRYKFHLYCVSANGKKKSLATWYY